ncbi:hypothetical protein [Fluviicola sp.]|jgi:hypothetical protein|uniref:hypothetical protein n=1 Tax=Fluviicola sp. TaxID=1917219 RepID=UPI002837D870|nr:hypothetical protein [Fluviicola sp.]MDR0801228.1 hypothetical protein [Fluviicola sp.]
MIDTEDNLKECFKKAKAVKKQIENEPDLQDTMVSSLRELLKWFGLSFPKKEDKNLWFADRPLILEQKKYLDVLIDLTTLVKQMHPSIEKMIHLDDFIDIGAFNERVMRVAMTLKYVHDGAIPSQEYEKLEWEDKIRSFAILPEDWDGEDAQKVPKSRILASIEFLKNLSVYLPNLKMVYPSWIGSVGLIYEIDNYKINVLFLSKDKVEISVVEPDSTLKSQKEYEINIVKSFESLLA